MGVFQAPGSNALDISSNVRKTMVELNKNMPEGLEYRIAYLAWPRAGDRVELRSGLVSTDARTMRVVHWMLDPATGAPWATSEAVAITFDLDARKVVPVTEAARRALAKHAVAGLAL